MCMISRYTATLNHRLNKYKSIDILEYREFEFVTGGAHTWLYHMLILYMLYTAS